MIGLDQNLVPQAAPTARRGGDDHARLRRALRAGLRHQMQRWVDAPPVAAAATQSTARAAGTATPPPRSARPGSGRRRQKVPSCCSRSRARRRSPTLPGRASQPDRSGAGREARPRRADVPPHPRGHRAARRRRPRRLRVDGALPEGGLHPVLRPPAGRLRRGGDAARPAADAGVGISSVLPVLRWSGPDEDARQAAVRAWRRAIQIAVDLGVDAINTEFNGRPEAAEHAEAMFLRSFDELAADLRARGHPPGPRAPPRRLHRGRARRGRHGRGAGPGLGHVPLLHAAHVPPGHDAAGIIARAGDRVTNVHLADTLDHTASRRPALHRQPARLRRSACTSTRRSARGEVDFDEVFAALAAAGFDGTLTSCVFGWEERARDDRHRAPRDAITALVAKHFGSDTAATPTRSGRTPTRRHRQDPHGHHAPPLAERRDLEGTGGRFGDVTDPATGEVTAQLALATEDDVERSSPPPPPRSRAGGTPRWPARPDPVPVPRAAQRPRRRAGRDHHRRARQGPLRRRAARSPAARRSSSSPAASRTCSRARPPRTPRPGSTCPRSASRSAWSASSRRSTSRPWCRCGSSRSRSPPATPSCSSRARRSRRRRCGWPSCGTRPACPTACSTC